MDEKELQEEKEKQEKKNNEEAHKFSKNIFYNTIFIKINEK